MADWVAYFCPHCGGTINEGDLDTDHGGPVTPSPGAPFTCGWCHTQTSDWSHVKRCRALAAERERQALARAGAETLALHYQLQKERRG